MNLHELQRGLVKNDFGLANANSQNNRLNGVDEDGNPTLKSKADRINLKLAQTRDAKYKLLRAYQKKRYRTTGRKPDHEDDIGIKETWMLW